jgi:hypothetical protein
MANIFQIFWSKDDEPYGFSVHATLEGATNFMNAQNLSGRGPKPVGFPSEATVHQLQIRDELNLQVAAELTTKPTIRLWPEDRQSNAGHRLWEEVTRISSNSVVAVTKIQPRHLGLA